MKLIDYLQKSGETDLTFAKRANISQPTIWRIRTGKIKKISADTARKIKHATNGTVSEMELLYPNDPPAASDQPQNPGRENHA